MIQTIVFKCQYKGKTEPYKCRYHVTRKLKLRSKIEIYEFMHLFFSKLKIVLI